MQEKLTQAFEALTTYDWGQDRKLLAPIDEAVIATHGDEDARAALEAKLVKALESDLSYDAKQFLCRVLMRVGSAASVPTLAELLSDEELSHMARFALERIPGEEASKALIDALATVNGKLKIGVLSSIGARGEDASVATLATLLSDGDPSVANSAALALGAIRSSSAAKALSSVNPTGETKSAVADATLACAESMLADGNKFGALAAYKGLLKSNPSSQVKLAATRGMLACAGK